MEHNLPPESAESLTNLEERLFNDWIEQQSACENCDGRKHCNKKIAVSYNEDGTVSFHSEDCPKKAELHSRTNASKLIKAAKIPRIFSNKRARDFDTSNQFNENAITIAEGAILDNDSTYIHGKCGAGKTLLACIIANERAYLGKSSYFVNVPDILEDLRDTSTNRENNRFELMRRMKDCACLIVDDLGAEKPSDWTCETLFRIFNHRYNEGAQTIVTSNFSIRELQNRLNFIAGERIVRRIRDTCTETELRR